MRLHLQTAVCAKVRTLNMLYVFRQLCAAVDRPGAVPGQCADSSEIIDPPGPFGVGIPFSGLAVPSVGERNMSSGSYGVQYSIGARRISRRVPRAHV